MCVTYVKITELRTDTTGEPPSLSKSTIRCKKYVRIFFFRGEGGRRGKFTIFTLFTLAHGLVFDMFTRTLQKMYEYKKYN